MWECFLFLSYTVSRVCHLCSLLTQYLRSLNQVDELFALVLPVSHSGVFFISGVLFICRVVSTISPFLTLLSGEAAPPPDLVIWLPVNFFELNLIFFHKTSNWWHDLVNESKVYKKTRQVFFFFSFLQGVTFPTILKSESNKSVSSIRQIVRFGHVSWQLLRAHGHIQVFIFLS